jgi:membrane-associated protein
MHNLLDPTHLAKTFGHLGIFLAIFLESGVIFGFFLPGDSLLFAAGLLASQHYLNIFLVIILAITGAILGNNTGYATGARLGHRLFKKKDSRFFSHKRVEEAHVFFEEQGAKSLILARFIPAVRTFVPIIAGVGTMRWRYFLLYNAIGGALWGLSMPLLGYTLGRTVKNIDHYILPAIFLIVIVSALPVLIHLRKGRARG